MKTTRLPTVLALLLAVLSLAAAEPAAAVLPPAPGAATIPTVPIRLRYDMTLLGARIGQADVEVGAVQKLGDGTPVRLVKTFGRTVGAARNLYSFENRIKTVFDARTYRPLRSDVTTVRAGTTRHYEYRSRGTRFESDVRGGDKPPKQEVHEVFEGTMGVPATLVWLSARALKPGEKDSVPVHTGNRAYRLFISGGEPEEVVVPAGTFLSVPVDCVLHETQAEDPGDREPRARWRVWVAADKRHAVVKLSATVSVVGDVEFELAGTRIEQPPAAPKATGGGPSVEARPPAAPSK